MQIRHQILLGTYMKSTILHRLTLRAVQPQDDVIIKKECHIRDQRPKLLQQKRYSFIQSKVVKKWNTLLDIIWKLTTSECSSDSNAFVTLPKNCWHGTLGSVVITPSVDRALIQAQCFRMMTNDAIFEKVNSRCNKCYAEKLH